MDSAGFSEDTLKAAQDILWVMRVPETLSQAKKLVKETPADEMAELEPGYWGTEVVCEYAGIQQRWLVVFSQAAHGRGLKTLEKAQAKELEKVQKEWRKLEGQAFKCQADAEKALEHFNQKWKYHQATAKTVAVMQYSRRGRPTAEDQKEVVGYNLQGTIAENTAAIEEAMRSSGRFIIATNDLDTERLSASAMLENYKDQGVSVERGFRFAEDFILPSL
jgi:transposase